MESSKDLDEIFKRLERYRKEKSIFIQVFDAKMIIGKDHLIWAYDKALRSFDQKTNRADSLEMETLLWSSGERQIKNAIKKMGITEDTDKAVIIIEKNEDEFLELMKWQKDDSIIKPSLDKLNRFGVKKEEIEISDNPYDLIFEKMSTCIIL